VSKIQVFQDYGRGEGWQPRTGYEDRTFEAVREQVTGLLNQDFSQVGADALPERVLLVQDYPSIAAEYKLKAVGVSLWPVNG
jgi:hypothetical protein